MGMPSGHCQPWAVIDCHRHDQQPKQRAAAPRRVLEHRERYDTFLRRATRPACALVPSPGAHQAQQRRGGVDPGAELAAPAHSGRRHQRDIRAAASGHAAAPSAVSPRAQPQRR
eukprot:364971-Chlamydomonas_euryale.AAC.9